MDPFLRNVLRHNGNTIRSSPEHRFQSVMPGLNAAVPLDPADPRVREYRAIADRDQANLDQLRERNITLDQYMATLPQPEARQRTSTGGVPVPVMDVMRYTAQ